MLLYLHIPFCDSKCHYCAFNSFTSNHHLKKEYLKALLTQLDYELEYFEVKKLTSIYIGGGTPSTFPVPFFEEIFKRVASLITPLTEITIEANPNSAKKEWVEGIYNLGVNRISFGVQSFDSKKLKFLGRNHTPKMAKEAINLAKRIGFKEINLDLIYGTKFDNEKFLEKEISTALTLPITHISAYYLTLEPNTPFFDKEEYLNPNEEVGYILKELIPFPQYEVSNFGKKRSIHNLGYWKLQPYIGVGAGAVGFKNKVRLYPPSDLKEYLQNPLKKEKEVLTSQELRLEKLFLGLRSCVGIKENLVKEKKAKLLIKEGKLIKKRDRFFNPNYFIADELALFLS
ncbi:MAG: coproporphyrinogen III oxidase family protein [Epsilonproteobacteria bacterium]|nr:coproporphyrinogen III oxidase family protein [Campylobacterota bacterium]